MGHPGVAIMLFAQTVSEQKEAAQEPSLLSPWMLFFLIVLLVGLPFLLGTLIARALKMKDLGTKIGVVLLAFELGLGPFVAEYIDGWLKQRQYEKQVATWKTKQAAREKITQSGRDALIEAVPNIDIRWEDQQTTPETETDN